MPAARHLPLLLALFCATLARGQTVPEISIFVDNKVLTVSGSEIPFYTPLREVDISVSLDDYTVTTIPARRIKFKIQELDQTWIQNNQTDMGLRVHFYNPAGDLIGFKYFSSTGDSPDWRDTPESSDFTHRRETLTVPADATHARLVITSAGPPHALGWFLVANLTVSGGRNLAFRASPRDWSRSGLRTVMAKIIQLRDVETFCLADDDRNSHAEWQLNAKAAIPVASGEQLTLEWDEMYSVGSADNAAKNYSITAPGRYHLIISEQDALGAAPAKETVYTFIVTTPFWRQPWFWALTVSVALTAVILATRHLVRARMQRQLEHLQQEHAVEMERLRIARNLHDDLGARLTHISLASSATAPADAADSLRKISRMTRELVAALYETVWTVDPKNDHLDALINYLSRMVSDLCEPANLSCRIKLDGAIDDRSVTSEIRHNVSLAVKEAVHNAIKYSRAAEIHAEFAFRSPTLTITIHDDGHGFDPLTVKSGHGLANMRQRLAAMGGTLTITSTPSQGTTVVFSISV